MEEFKNKSKQYSIFELSLPDNYKVSGVAISDLYTSFHFNDLLNKDEENYLKLHYSAVELVKKQFFTLSDVLSFYCTTFGYSIVSVQKIMETYRFLITLIKD